MSSRDIISGVGKDLTRATRKTVLEKVPIERTRTRSEFTVNEVSRGKVDSIQLVIDMYGIRKRSVRKYKILMHKKIVRRTRTPFTPSPTYF